MYKTLLALVFGGCQLAQAAVARPHPARRDGSTPSLPHDDKTTEFCTWWVDYTKVIDCNELLHRTQITIEQFKRWNPSVQDNCKGMTVGRSYCSEALFEEEPETGSDPEPTPGPSDQPQPSPTKPSNGVETPAAVQPGMVNNCNKFAFVELGGSCADIATKHGITLTQFTTWNKGVGTTCNSLWGNTYACVSVIGFESPSPSQPTSSNGIETPSPIQANVNKNCNKFHKISPTTTCTSIKDYYKLPLEDFYSWNPSVGKSCQALIVDYWVCVSVVGWSAPISSAAPSPTKPANGISTPSPIQAGIHKDCNKFHKISSTTTCASIQSYYNLPLKDFYSWNPSVGTSCQALLVNYWVCVSITGWKPPVSSPTPSPSPTQPSNGINTPSHIQPKMTKSCNKFHTVMSTTTCSSIQNYYKISLSQFVQWNPDVGSSCSALLVDYNVCVGVIGQKPSPTSPSNGIPTPSPVQPGVVRNCKKFHLVSSTTTCASIQNYYKITMAQLAKWNPTVGSDCKALWAGYYVCISA
ncbi:unnamed protein product [Fusarium graminearum]|nr:hypothetical protein FG05_30304 [Fusarium graminearum]KAI6759960.1 hypothetical protein HG531_013533 [Fusarium graminearum]CAG1974669.1 unnamed protein product [Fusarium graminearum]CZS82988.1 unnamed protein product [Fusarium graminearum]